MVNADQSRSRVFTAKGLATRERILSRRRTCCLRRVCRASAWTKCDKKLRSAVRNLAHYFTDRDDLIRAVVERQIEGVLDFHRQPKLGGLDTFDDWERWIDLEPALSAQDRLSGYGDLPHVGRPTREIR